MEAYAVIETGGKQYLVRKKSVLDIERLEGEEGKDLTLSKVLAVSDGKELKVGTPDITGAEVTAEVVKQWRGPKVISFKKKRRKGYHKKIGHRQELTRIKVQDIKAG